MATPAEKRAIKRWRKKYPEKFRAQRRRLYQRRQERLRAADAMQAELAALKAQMAAQVDEARARVQQAGVEAAQVAEEAKRALS